MIYLLLNDKNIAFAMVFDKPADDTKHIELEAEEKEALVYLGKIWTETEFIEPLTEEEQERLNIKCEIEYIKCLMELNSGI